MAVLPQNNFMEPCFKRCEVNLRREWKFNGGDKMELLRGRILELSSTTDWEEAIMEWVGISYCNHGENSAICVCSQSNLSKCYVLQNRKTKQLAMLGSCCVLKFQRPELNEWMTWSEQFDSILKSEPQTFNVNTNFTQTPEEEKRKVYRLRKGTILYRFCLYLLQNPRQGISPSFFRDLNDTVFLRIGPGEDTTRIVFWENQATNGKIYLNCSFFTDLSKYFSVIDPRISFVNEKSQQFLESVRYAREISPAQLKWLKDIYSKCLGNRSW